MSLIAEEGRDGVPQVGPRLKGGRWQVRTSGAQEFGKKFAALEWCRFPGSDPIGKRRAALFSPMPQQRGLANPAATIEHDQLARTRVRAGQDTCKKGEFRSPIDKHHSLRLSIE